VNDTDTLRNVLQQYARAADARDLDALAALVHPDAVIEGSRGVQTLGEWLDAMRGPRPFPVSMHLLGDPLIELDGDVARLDTYAVVFQIGDGNAGQADLTLGIRYFDELTRTSGRWRIHHHRATTVWVRGGPQQTGG
jgi:ketosteroid isomerase-like protein